MGKLLQLDDIQDILNTSGLASTALGFSSLGGGEVNDTYQRQTHTAFLGII